MTAKQLRRVIALRNGAAVKRFHTKTIIGEITNGQHLFGAVSLLLLLHPLPTLELIKATAWHDMAEYHVGDTPSPVLWKDPEFNKFYVAKEYNYLRAALGLDMDRLSPEEHAWLLGVDKLDCYLWAREQFQLGNQGARRTLKNLEYWFAGEQHLPKEILEFYCELRKYGWDEDLEEALNDSA